MYYLHLSQSIKISNSNTSSDLREKEILACKFSWKKFIVFGSNFLKMLVLFDKNFCKNIYLSDAPKRIVKIKIISFFISMILGCLGQDGLINFFCLEFSETSKKMVINMKLAFTSVLLRHNSTCT